MKSIQIPIIIFFILIFNSTTLLAQAPDTLWTRTFGSSQDEGHSVQQTSDGGYIVTGWTASIGAGGSDVWLIKTDASGDTIWTRTFGGSGMDKGRSVQQTTDGGYVVAGNTASFGAGGFGFWLIKTDSSGDTIWTKTFGGRGSDSDYGHSVQQTSDGGYVVTGDNGFGVWLIKTDASGDTLWTRIFVGGGVGYSVQQTSDGGYIVAGETGSSVWLIKTDAWGDTLWTRTFGGNDSDCGHSVQQTTDGGYIVAGVTSSVGAGFYNVWLIKTAADPSQLENKNLIVLPTDYVLKQNYPNPFNPITRIEFSLPKFEFVELKVYNILGKEVSTLVSEKLIQGNHIYTFDGKNLASGIYYYQLTAGDYRQVKKMILLR
jgi:hypothetical protein